MYKQLISKVLPCRYRKSIHILFYYTEFQCKSNLKSTSNHVTPQPVASFYTQYPNSLTLLYRTYMIWPWASPPNSLLTILLTLHFTTLDFFPFLKGSKVISISRPLHLKFTLPWAFSSPKS